jgi:hypothetical protein
MLSECQIHVHAGDSNSRPPEYELGALTKCLASWVSCLGLDRLLHSYRIIRGPVEKMIHEKPDIKKTRDTVPLNPYHLKSTKCRNLPPPPSFTFLLASLLLLLSQ